MPLSGGALLQEIVPLQDLLRRGLEAPAFLFFTSGSTGPAKGVIHSHRSLAATLAINAQGFGLAGADVVLPASSMAHLGAFFMPFAGLSVGARAAGARGPTPEEIAFLAELPRNPTGNLDRVTLKRMGEERAAGHPPHQAHQPGRPSRGDASLGGMRRGIRRLPACIEAPPWGPVGGGEKTLEG